jgi:hypothetical protein
LQHSRFAQKLHIETRSDCVCSTSAWVSLSISHAVFADQQPQHFGLRRKLDQRPLDRLVLDQRAAERFSLAGVFHRFGQAAQPEKRPKGLLANAFSRAVSAQPRRYRAIRRGRSCAGTCAILTGREITG